MTSHHFKAIQVPAESEVALERERLKQVKEQRSSGVKYFSVLAVVAAILVVAATCFLFFVKVTGESMEPTLQYGDVLFVVNTNNIQTGDVIAFECDGTLYVKRVIACSGDTIDMDEDGNVYINGTQLHESYIINKSIGKCTVTFPITLAEGTYFVMGDNRSESIDSRNDTIGCVSDYQIVGKVVAKIFPVTSIQLIC